MKKYSRRCTCCDAPAAQQDFRYLKLDSVIAAQAGKPGALIPVLQSAQSIFGYLPEDVIKYISEKMNEPYSKVFGVVTFYSFFARVPRGRHVVRVCMGTACYVKGAQNLIDTLKTQLGVGVGQTTSDNAFTLDVGRCFGACGLAPAIMVNDVVHQCVKPEEIPAILDQYRHGAGKGGAR